MAKTEAAGRVVVCDAGPLIHLDELSCLDLLSDFAEVLVSAAVWDEVLQHRPSALRHPGSVLRRVDETDFVAADLSAIARLFALHLGEFQSLQLATQQAVDLLLTDDTAARLAARQLGVSVHGTLGILLRSIRRGQRTASQVAAKLRSLPETSTLHIKQKLLHEIIREVERDR